MDSMGGTGTSRSPSSVGLENSIKKTEEICLNWRLWIGNDENKVHGGHFLQGKLLLSLGLGG